MSTGLVRARSTLLFLFALVVAGLAVWWIETHADSLTRGRPASAQQEIPASSDLPPLSRPRGLSDTERQWARTAWKYFENNTDKTTGLVQSVDGFPSTTLWDTGSALLGLIAAHRLELISQDEFDQRATRMLDALQRLPLVDQALPNKAYHTGTLAMVDYTNHPAPQGTGWSALDLARLLVPLHVLAWEAPQHTNAVRKLLARLDFSRVLAHGQLQGGARNDSGQWQLLQEGRLGYEQYAARSFALLGLDVSRAADWHSFLTFSEVEGVAVPHDRRSVRELGAVDYATSEPYLLDGLEFGWDSNSRELAWRIYQAQERRFLRSGTLTAVTEDHLDQAPFFIYSTVYADGREWNVLTPRGKDAGNFRNLSVKAAFGWHALYARDYSQRLVNAVAGLADPAKGWYAGRYEKNGQPNRSINCNTNAVVLESLAYIAGGPLLRLR